MFEAKLGQAALFKKIIEAIKDLVTDAPFDCTEMYMSLQAMDASHVALVSLKLETGIFEKYRCDRTVCIALSLTDLSKVLKCAKNEDSCLIRYDEDNGDSVTFTFEDTHGRKQDIVQNLMTIDVDHLGIPDSKYACIIEMPSAEFQRTCRDIAMFSDSLSICGRQKSNSVVFSGKGDSVTNIVTYTSGSTSADDDESEIVSIDVRKDIKVSYSIKFMNHFTKATSLCSRVRISVSNNVPMTVEYGIEDNGYLRFYLAPKIEESGDADME